MVRIFLLVALLAGCLNGAYAEVDPNLWVYLCFGQSNMEGNADWESVDNQVDNRFRMLATTRFDNPSRALGKWYTAKCPIVSPAGKLGVSDYFGRTMVAALPKDVKVGVVAVAMGGSPIEMFDKDKYSAKLAEHPTDWWATLSNMYYGGNPYQRLIDMGRKAQESGVIKGILLHQGCSNNSDPNWPKMVKKIYNDILNDLGLEAKNVPLFVGELLRQDQGGVCYGHNNVIATMPKVVPTSHVVHSTGCPGNGNDPWHFCAAGYRTMGKRYAYEALRTMGLPTVMNEEYKLSVSLKRFYSIKSFDTHYDAKARATVTLQLWATFTDGHREDLTEEATFSSENMKITNGKVHVAADGTGGTVTATYIDFLGTQHNVEITIGNVPTSCIGIVAGRDVTDDAIYDLSGNRVAAKSDRHRLPHGIYVVGGKKVMW